MRDYVIARLRYAVWSLAAAAHSPIPSVKLARVWLPHISVMRFVPYWLSWPGRQRAGCVRTESANPSIRIELIKGFIFHCWQSSCFHHLVCVRSVEKGCDTNQWERGRDHVTITRLRRAHRPSFAWTRFTVSLTRGCWKQGCKGQGPRSASWILPPCDVNTSKITQCQRFSRYHAGSEGVCDGHHKMLAKYCNEGGGTAFTCNNSRNVERIFSEFGIRQFPSIILTRSNRKKVTLWRCLREFLTACWVWR